MAILAISPGASGRERFALRAVRPDEARLTAYASFEVHLGYPGPAYWGGASSGKDVVLAVEGSQ
jgi:hypothetical protein